MENVSLENTAIKAGENKKDGMHSEIKIADSYVKQLTVDEIIEEFPKLAKGGQLVNAMKGIQGHSRFVWFYKLVDMVNRKYFCEEKKKQAEVKKEIRAEHPVLEQGI